MSCCIDGCAGQVKARKMCQFHYRRVLRGVSPHDMPRLPFDVFEAAADQPSMLALSRATGKATRALYDYRLKGVPLFMADRLAVKIGMHPAEIWVDWYQVAA